VIAAGGAGGTSMPKLAAKLSQSLGVDLGGGGGAGRSALDRGSRRAGGAAGGSRGSAGGAAPSSLAKTSQLDFFSGFSILKARPIEMRAADTLRRCSCQFTISFLSIGLSWVVG
jgi:hypothetical protein